MVASKGFFRNSTAPSFVARSRKPGFSLAVMKMIGVAAVAAVVSYEHASDLVRAHGETGFTARLIPLTVDGLIYAARW